MEYLSLSNGGLGLMRLADDLLRMPYIAITLTADHVGRADSDAQGDSALAA